MFSRTERKKDTLPSEINSHRVSGRFLLRNGEKNVEKLILLEGEEGVIFSLSFNHYPTPAEIPDILTLMEKEELEKLEILLEIFNDRTKEDDFQQDEGNDPFYN